jgi:threonine dehydratase
MLGRACMGTSSRLAASRVVYAPASTLNSHSVLNSRWFSAAEESAEETTEKPAAQKNAPPAKQHFDELPVQYADISRAHVAIRDGVVRTECKRSHFISELVGANVYLKTEQRQFTGSFKERGARNALLQLIQSKGEEFQKTGAIAASAGNHALALAYHGRQLGIPVTVVMPTVAPLAKVDKCRVCIIGGVLSMVVVVVE